MQDNVFRIFSIKDKKILNLLNKTLTFSFIVCLFGILLMYIFLKKFISFDLYEAAIIVFRTGLFIGTSAVMSALIVNNYNS